MSSKRYKKKDRERVSRAGATDGLTEPMNQRAYITPRRGREKARYTLRWFGGGYHNDECYLTAEAGSFVALENSR